MAPTDPTRPLFWAFRGQIMGWATPTRPVVIRNPATLLAFYRREGTKHYGEAREHLARCFCELHQAMGDLHRSAA